MTMTNYSPLWPHGEIESVFQGIYVVRGTNITSYADNLIQHSRNMIIVDTGGALTLINTVRLNDTELVSLDKLGSVAHIVRIGAFHGRDDRFYLDRYPKAEYWTVAPGDIEESRENRVHEIDQVTNCPLSGGTFYRFVEAEPSEGYLYLPQHDGVIITCDSIKNWVKPDHYFSKETATDCLAQGEIAKARISPIWLNATGVTKMGFEKLLSHPFKHLISAHGDVLKDTAHEDVDYSLKRLDLS